MGREGGNVKAEEWGTEGGGGKGWRIQDSAEIEETEVRGWRSEGMVRGKCEMRNVECEMTQKE
jgi:hypothetical protein